MSCELSLYALLQRGAFPTSVSHCTGAAARDPIIFQDVERVLSVLGAQQDYFKKLEKVSSSGHIELPIPGKHAAEPDTRVRVHRHKWLQGRVHSLNVRDIPLQLRRLVPHCSSGLVLWRMQRKNIPDTAFHCVDKCSAY